MTHRNHDSPAIQLIHCVAYMTTLRDPKPTPDGTKTPTPQGFRGRVPITFSGNFGLKVAQAEGVEARGFNGFDPAAFAPGASEEAAKGSIAAMVAFNRPNPKSHSGVWRDLAVRKRRTEVDAQIAPIAEIGARHGLECPTIRRLVSLIHDVEDGKRPMTDDNLLELMRP